MSTVDLSQLRPEHADVVRRLQDWHPPRPKIPVDEHGSPDYSACGSPPFTIQRMMASPAYIRGVRGPIGSGSSTSCVVELWLQSLEQEPDAQGRRRTRFCVTRSSYPELESTTMTTVRDWLCPLMKIVKTAPMRGTYSLPMTDGTVVESEWVFLSMDKPEDTAKVLSLELSHAWVNEASESLKCIISAISQRVGRFPALRDGGPTRPGVIMDTNSPADDHWWYKYAELGEWRTDAAAMNEAGEIDIAGIGEDLRAYLVDGGVSQESADRLVRSYVEGSTERPQNVSWEFFAQPGGLIYDQQRGYLPNPAAENVENLQGGFDYYFKALPGMSPEERESKILGNYAELYDGRAVYANWFNKSFHVAQSPLLYMPRLPLILSWDFGQTPACLIGQVTTAGQVRVLHEVQAWDGGVRQIAENQILPLLRSKFYDAQIIVGTGDPAMLHPSDADASITAKGTLQELGLPAEPAMAGDTQAIRFGPRREAVLRFLDKRIEGTKPGIIIDPECDITIKGLAGHYQFRRIQAGGHERYTDDPIKNKYSHLQDCLQYLCLWAIHGHVKRSVRPLTKAKRTRSARQTWRGMT